MYVVFFFKQKTAYEMRISDWSQACALPIYGSSTTTHAKSRSTDRIRTAGTKIRSNRSVKRCVGDFCVSASLTIFTTLASALSLERRVTSISIAPPPLIVPAKTRLSASRSEEHTSELQSLMRISYAVFCLKKKTQYTT